MAQVEEHGLLPDPVLPVGPAVSRRMVRKAYLPTNHVSKPIKHLHDNI